MSALQASAAFPEKDFELLAQTLDSVSAARRELFLTKLVILLVADNDQPGVMQSCVERARRDLDI